MKDETIIVRRRKTDRKLVRLLPDGREQVLAHPGPLRSDAAIEAAALSGVRAKAEGVFPK